MFKVFASFAAALGGPVVGLYMMGLFVPWANWKVSYLHHVVVVVVRPPGPMEENGMFIVYMYR